MAHLPVTTEEETALKAPAAFIPISEPVEEEPPQEVAPTPDIVTEPPVGIEAVPTGPTIISDQQFADQVEQDAQQLQDITAQQTEAVRIEAEKKAIEAQKPPELTELEKLGTISEGEGVFRNPNTGQLQRFFNPDINAERLVAAGFEFVAGTDISPEVRSTQETKLGINTQDVESAAKADAELDAEEAENKQNLEKLEERADLLSKGIIEDIKATFAIRRDRLKDINKRALESQRILGIRSGRQRFAAEIQTSILSAEERAGLSRLVELDVEEKGLLIQAETAAIARDFELLNARMTRVREVRKEKAEALEKQSAMAIKEEELAIKKSKEARESAKFVNKIKEDLISEIGIIALNSLTGDETTDANIIQQLAFANEINPNTLLAKILRQDQELTKGGANFKFIAGTAKQQSGVFNSKTGIFTPQKGGVGGVGGIPGRITAADLETASNEELTDITRVMRLLPTKLKDSEQERLDRKVEILRGLRGGQTIQDLVDEIKGFVITNRSQQGFATYMRTLAAGTNIDLSDLAATINRGNLEKTMTIIENENLKEVNGELKNVADARTMISQANRVLELLEKVPVENLGAFDGRKFKVKKFRGLSDEDIVKTQTLETAIVNLLNEIRRKSLGTAVTKAEIAFLEPLLTDLLDQPAIIKAKMSELKTGVLIEHNNARLQATLPEVTEDEILDNKLRLKRYQEAANISNQMKIRITSTGQTGTIDASEFDPETMEQI